jgi:transglutaminase-like putative cysteine protease
VQSGLDASMVAACTALLGTFVARMLTRQTPSHDLHSLVLSLLLVFAGTVLQQQFMYGLVLIAYTVTGTWALVTRQLIHGSAMEAYRTDDWAVHAATLSRRDVVTPTFFVATAGVAVLLLLGTSFVFLAFPRVGLGGLGFGQRHATHFPGDVSLAGPPRATGDDTVVARLWGVSYDDFIRGLYLRGTLYDTASDAGFRASPSLLDVKPQRLALARGSDKPVAYEVYLQPIADQALFALGPVDKASVGPTPFVDAAAFDRVATGAAGELVSINSLTGPVRYRVQGALTRVPPPLGSTVATDADVEVVDFVDQKFTQHFLALPPNLDPRVLPLARQVVGDATTFGAKALRLRRYLLANYTYSIEQANAGRADPLAGFLFDDRRGHCEYFATAYAVLLRAVGVPSRVVGGLQGGKWEATGPTVIFTGANAHAWVEWYAPGQGWLADDATPYREATSLTGYAAWLERMRRLWDDEVVDFGLDQQLTILRGIIGAVHSGGQSPGRLLQAGNIPWQALWRALFSCGVLAAMFWGSRRMLRRRRGRAAGLTPLAQVLLATLARLRAAPVAVTITLRQAVEGVTAGADATTGAALRGALAAYEGERFAGRTLPAADLRTWQDILKRL